MRFNFNLCKAFGSWHLALLSKKKKYGEEKKENENEWNIFFFYLFSF
jgi:hypothetical protein